MARVLRSILAWALVGPSFAFGYIACGLDTTGGEPEATIDASVREAANLPPSGGDSETPVVDSGPDPDATTPETCPWPSLERDAPWPMIGGCVGHPGRTVHRGPKSKPKIVWTVTVTTRETQPVVGADGTVYVPADVNGVFAFAPDGGSRPIGDAGTGASNSVTNVPSIGADGTLYFGAGHDVVALKKDGTSWRFATKDEIDTSTLIDEDGTVYSGSSDNAIHALFPDGGKRWERDLGDDVAAAPAIGPTREIYVGTTKKLFALQRDGGLSWSFDPTGDIQSSPVVADDGTIYIGTLGSRLHAVTPDGGAKWSFVTKGNFGWQQLPALGRDGTIFSPTGSYLAAINPADGGTKWEVNVTVPLRTSVVIDGDGRLYVGGDRMMYAFDPVDGTKLWELDLGENPFGFAIGRDGTLFVACDNNKLLALQE
ncbi:MAG: PQQ-like beta-propeller repeat protein [Myxococcales bacterium]|nr:PQQ-like beta-propeller repeat protein [Myxococcales bacterium]